MSDPGPPTERTRVLNRRPERSGRYVLYWMQQSQRADWNHALNHAVRESDRLGLPVVTVFALDEGYPEANLRHFQFMWEGLMETAATLASRGIRFVLRRGRPPEVVLPLSHDAALLVCDRGYLRHQKEWRREVASHADGPVVEVESDVIVPVQAVSEKAEFAARTIRPKLYRNLDRFLVEPEFCAPRCDASALHITGEDFAQPGWLDRLALDRTVAPVSGHFRGGSGEARRRFLHFLEQVLPTYAVHRNQPQFNHVSGMSPYLHFGQISPLELAMRAQERSAAARPDVEVFLEELVVRRELSMNFAEYCPDYDRYQGLPAWARDTLGRHRRDPRGTVYGLEELSEGRTHDPYWNASMREMRVTGSMHNYMRMYWGKKILEWSPDPESGYRTALTLNNRYFLDGRDPNSYAGVGWVFGLHDRPWGERPVFGTVRYMAASGLERKCDIRGYVERISALDEPRTA